MTQPIPPVPDLDAIRAELAEIKDRFGDRHYRGETAWFSSMWANVGRHVPALLAEVERQRALADRLRDYHPDGRCRICNRKESEHREYCRLYVGPLTHVWARTRVNPTFGGIDYDCRCGGWFRQGGMAGHGDGTDMATPVCPNAEQTYRGAS